MTKEQAEKVLNELQDVRPEMLNGEAKRLFEAIMKIADKRDELKQKAEEQDKIIDLMSEWLYEDDTSFGYGNLKEINTKEKIKQYFENKAKEEKYK